MFDFIHMVLLCLLSLFVMWPFSPLLVLVTLGAIYHDWLEDVLVECYYSPDGLILLLDKFQTAVYETQKTIWYWQPQHVRAGHHMDNATINIRLPLNINGTKWNLGIHGMLPLTVKCLRNMFTTVYETTIDMLLLLIITYPISYHYYYFRIYLLMLAGYFYLIPIRACLHGLTNVLYNTMDVEVCEFELFADVEESPTSTPESYTPPPTPPPEEYESAHSIDEVDAAQALVALTQRFEHVFERPYQILTAGTGFSCNRPGIPSGNAQTSPYAMMRYAYQSEPKNYELMAQARRLMETYDRSPMMKRNVQLEEELEELNDAYEDFVDLSQHVESEDGGIRRQGDPKVRQPVVPMPDTMEIDLDVPEQTIPERPLQHLLEFIDNSDIIKAQLSPLFDVSTMNYEIRYNLKNYLTQVLFLTREFILDVDNLQGTDAENVAIAMHLGFFNKGLQSIINRIDLLNNDNPRNLPFRRHSN